jgi:hypothetical protein
MGVYANGDYIAQAIVSTAAFDPITIMDPANPSRLLYMASYFPGGPFYGCRREAYHGPVYFRNRFGPTVYQTDAAGRVTPGGPVRQEVSMHEQLGVLTSVRPNGEQQQQFKQVKNYCAPGLGLQN